MGLPIKHRKKFVSHKKRWDKQTIVDEAVLVNDYALKNKKEIRKIELMLSKYKSIAKSLNRTVATKQSSDAENFINSLKNKGFLKMDATSLDEVLDIGMRDILDRRLSNILYKKKLARTPKQARQFVVHGHVKVAGVCVSSPSYMVSLGDEDSVEFLPNSALADESHPDRIQAMGGMVEIEEMEKIPLKNKNEKSFDDVEEQMDDEEVLEEVEE